MRKTFVFIDQLVQHFQIALVYEFVHFVVVMPSPVIRQKFIQSIVNVLNQLISPKNKTEFALFETMGEIFEFKWIDFIKFGEQCLDVCPESRGRINHKTLVLNHRFRFTHFYSFCLKIWFEITVLSLLLCQSFASIHYIIYQNMM